MLFPVVPVTMCGMNTPQNQEQVGELVRHRRQQMALTAAALAKKAGVDAKTLRSLERGERWPIDASRSRIETALRWKTGALDALLEGTDPDELQLGDPDAFADGATMFQPTDSPVRDLRRIGKILGLDTDYLDAIDDFEARPVLAQLTIAYHNSSLAEAAEERRRAAFANDAIDSFTESITDGNSENWRP